MASHLLRDSTVTGLLFSQRGYICNLSSKLGQHWEWKGVLPVSTHGNRCKQSLTQAIHGYSHPGCTYYCFVVLPKIHTLKFSPQSIWRWSLWEVIMKVELSGMGLVSLLEARDLANWSSAMWGYEKSAVYNMEESSSQMQPCWHSDLRLPASRNVRNIFCCL